MAEQLGEAVLRVTVDDSAAKEKLDGLRQEITRIESRTGSARRSTSPATRGVVGPTPPPITNRNEVRQFNLRGTLAALEGIAEDIGRISAARQGTRQINIGSSWIKALELLQETKEDIDSISASKNLNLRSSWSTALALLSETKEDIDSISASKNLNIRSSWSTALALLSETKEDIDSISASKNLNLRSSWSTALALLSETKEDIDSISASKNLNLRASWAKALGQLSEIQEDLTQVAAAKDLNLNASWTGALATLSEIDADLQNIAASKKLNIRASWQTALRQLQETADEAARIRLDENIAQGRRIGAQNVSPIRGGAAFPGSPAYLDAIFPKFPEKFFNEQNKRVQDAAKRRADILSNALIGGAFPALFGQGLGASIGGAAGGAAGGAIGGQFGFGLSLIGTALGAQFDVALNKAKELAKALDNPITQFSAIKDNALLSSKGLEKNVEALIATGREAEAAALIQEDLIKKFGNTEEVERFANETDKLNRAWTETTVTLAAFVSGPLADLVQKISAPIRANATANQLARAQANLTPAQLKQLRQFERRRQDQLGITPTGGLAVSGVGASDTQVVQLNLSLLEEINRIQGKNNGALERATRTQNIIVQSASSLLKLEDAIGRARLGGNKPLEESLTLTKNLLSEYKKRKELEQRLSAKQITAPEFSREFRASQDTERSLKQEFVDTSREGLITAVQELQITKQLAGLEGTRLEVAKRRAELSKAFQTRELRERQLIDASTASSLDPTSEAKRVLKEGALNAFLTAGVEFETKLRQASDYLKNAAKEAAQNLTTALQSLGKLESNPGGLNRFLTGAEQTESTRKAILRLGGDDRKGPSQLESAIAKATELLGLTRGQANDRFQGLRDIVAGAKQGRLASQEGFDALSTFIDDVRAREQAVTGLGDAQKTLADVTSLNATVQQELTAAVQQNTTALDAVLGKDWSVNLSVQGGEVAAYGDVLSRLTP